MQSPFSEQAPALLAVHNLSALQTLGHAIAALIQQ